jgi:hypothetical protein
MKYRPAGLRRNRLRQIAVKIVGGFLACPEPATVTCLSSRNAPVAIPTADIDSNIKLYCLPVCEFIYISCHAVHPLKGNNESDTILNLDGTQIFFPTKVSL